MFDDVKPFHGKVLPGMTVLWYKGGNENSKPIPCTVYEGFGNGCARLITPDVSGVPKTIIDSCYHCRHPMLKDKDLNPSGNAINYGCWDFCPHSDASDRRFIEKVEKEEQRKREAIEAEKDAKRREMLAKQAIEEEAIS